MNTVNLSRSLGVACVAAFIAGGCAHSAHDELTVRRINLVDESGETRLVISGDLPDPVVRGERLKRDIAPAGILWHDEDSDESGGIGVAPVSRWWGAPSGKVRMITFDFTHQITDGVRLGTYESDDGETWEGGLTVHDRRPFSPGPIESSQGNDESSWGHRTRMQAW